MCVFKRMLLQPGYQLQASASCLMNKAETRDGKPTRQQMYDQSKCSVPLLYIIKHGSNWKQTSERTPSKFSTCSAPPSVHFPLFSLRLPSLLILQSQKQMESLGQKGGKQITDERVRKNGVRLNKQFVQNLHWRPSDFTKNKTTADWSVIWWLCWIYTI